jgi:hypothetical protein
VNAEFADGMMIATEVVTFSPTQTSQTDSSTNFNPVKRKPPLAKNYNVTSQSVYNTSPNSDKK